MMKIFTVSELPVKQYVLESNCDGISLALYASNILMGDTYNSGFMADVRNEIKLIGDYEKQVSIGIIFGEYSTNSIFDKYPFVEFVKRHHKGTGEPKKIKIPVFYSAIYLLKILEAITWFANELNKDEGVYDVIDSVKVTGCNESTLEMRATSQTWETATTQAQAYDDAAKKWISAGYDTATVFNACTEFIEIFKINFPDKKLVLPYIPMLNGFPCISNDGKICKPKQRINLTALIMAYGIQVSGNFHPQFTAYDGKPIGETYVQINQQKLGNPKPPYDDTEFKKVLSEAEKHGIENIEVFHPNILFYPKIFKK